MTDAASPSLTTRLRATLHREVSADMLEAYKRAGLAVYDALADAEERRAALAAEPGALWRAAPAEQAQLAATWNAWAFQLLGDELLAADYRTDPGTVGYVPRVTHAQALSFYEEVEPWLGRSRRAQGDPGVHLATELPAELPPWAEVEPCPREHLEAMRSACQSLCEHAELALADAERSAGEAQRDDVAALRGRLAAALSAAEYAQALDQDKLPLELHERIEDGLKRAIEGAHRVGQLAAAPRLLERSDAFGPPDLAASAPRLPGPGEPGWDPWLLTDPETRERWKRDRRARRAIEQLWRADPDPRRTLELQSQIEEGMRENYLIYARTQGRPLGNYFCCPWSPIYEVAKPVAVGGQRLARGTQFTLDVSAEEMAEGGPFVRRILTGDFRPTSEVDYCDPSAGGHG